MSSGARLEVVGARQLRASLKRLGDDLGDFAEVHARVGGLVAREASGRVRSRSGALAGSSRPGHGKTSALVRFGGARVPYAGAVHWGTGARPGRRGPHNITPQRFATTAAAESEPTWVEWYLEAVERMVAKVRGA